jgi:hypothetical protein
VASSWWLRGAANPRRPVRPPWSGSGVDYERWGRARASGQQRRSGYCSSGQPAGSSTRAATVDRSGFRTCSEPPSICHRCFSPPQTVRVLRSLSRRPRGHTTTGQTDVPRSLVRAASRPAENACRTDAEGPAHVRTLGAARAYLEIGKASGSGKGQPNRFSGILHGSPLIKTRGGAGRASCRHGLGEPRPD